MSATFLLLIVAAGIAYFYYPTTRQLSQDEPQETANPPTTNPSTKSDGPTFNFVDVSEHVAVDFVHNRGYTDARHLPSANGSGLGLIDFDLDGMLDLFLLTGNNLPIVAQTELAFNALYQAQGPFRFIDVTQSAGLSLADYSHGVTSGDFDNDGFIDLYVTCLNTNHLYQNNGDGTFAETGPDNPVSDSRWSSGAAFFDFDRDGDLDLYVSNYGQWNVQKNPECSFEEKPIYCRPVSIDAQADALFENMGDGTFTEITKNAGVFRQDGRGLGVVAADVNDDRNVDIYVANDMSINYLFLNLGDGTFSDVSLSSGAGVSGEGKEQAGMGADIADINNDGLPEIFVTNYWLESHTLYQNTGNARFVDATNWSGLGSQSIPDVGWGTAVEDFDNDGWSDIFVANGTLESDFEYEPRVPHRFWRNLGTGRFALARGGTGSFFDSPGNARGTALGDIDNDGDWDIVLNQNDDGPALLRNDQSNRSAGRPPNAWIRFELVGARSNRSAIGASVVIAARERNYYRQVKGGGSYLSVNDFRLLIGLGDREQVDSATTIWPSGSTDQLEELAARNEFIIKESF